MFCGSGGFFLAYEEFGRTFGHSIPRLRFSFFLSFIFIDLFYFFEAEISSRTLIPLFTPRSVHSGSASWDDCGWVFPDECGGSRDSLLVEHRTRDRKVVSSNPGRSGRRIFFLRVNFVCLLLFAVLSIPVLPQWHVKDPGHPAKRAGDRLHLKTRTPLTQRSRSGLTMPPSRHSVGTCPETSSHATCQRTLGHSRLSLLSHCRLILAVRVELVCTS